jgi:hypothetical protein
MPACNDKSPLFTAPALKSLAVRRHFLLLVAQCQRSTSTYNAVYGRHSSCAFAASNSYIQRDRYRQQTRA